MTKDEAIEQLADAEVVPCVSAGIPEAKEILNAFLSADIPAILDRQTEPPFPQNPTISRVAHAARPRPCKRVPARVRSAARIEMSVRR